MQITMQGKYQTRGSAKYPSLPVRILATDMKGVDGTVIGLITEPSGWQYPACWKADGKALELGVTESFADLIPVPTKHEGWCLVDTLAPTYPTRARAERAFDEGNYAVTPIGNPRYRIVFYTWED